MLIVYTFRKNVSKCVCSQNELMILQGYLFIWVLHHLNGRAASPNPYRLQASTRAISFASNFWHSEIPTFFHRKRHSLSLLQNAKSGRSRGGFVCGHKAPCDFELSLPLMRRWGVLNAAITKLPYVLWREAVSSSTHSKACQIAHRL